MKPTPSEINQLLAKLFACLDAQDKPGARAAVDAIAAVRSRRGPEKLSAPPPRRVSVAMAMAVFGQPHLAITFARHGAEDTVIGEVEQALLLPSELVERALGLTTWELDDIRDEIDQRVGRTLKQSRALQWMWTHFGLPDASPEPLFRVLFPGAPSTVGQVALVRRGPQLYALVSQSPPPPVSSLYMSWLGLDPEQCYPPLRTFGGRYVDRGLIHALARSIGASNTEVQEILDEMVTILPQQQMGSFLARDFWRSYAVASLTALGQGYRSSAWLVGALAPDELNWSDWIVKDDDGGLTLRSARAVFDRLALERITSMTRQLYAAFLATLVATPPSGRLGASDEDLVLFDLEHHIDGVLAPLLGWTEASATAAAIAREAGVELGVASAALSKVHDIWHTQAITAWNGPPLQASGPSVRTLIAAHFAGLHASIRRAYAHTADARWPHKRLLILFVAHYLAEAPLARLWIKRLAEPVPAVFQPSPDTDPFPVPEDVVGDWFWGTWQRVLHAVEQAANDEGHADTLDDIDH